MSDSVRRARSSRVHRAARAFVAVGGAAHDQGMLTLDFGCDFGWDLITHADVPIAMLAQEVAGGVAILADLLDQRLDAVELALSAQPLHELNPQVGAVNVLVRSR